MLRRVLALWNRLKHGSFGCSGEPEGSFLRGLSRISCEKGGEQSFQYAYGRTGREGFVRGQAGSKLWGNLNDGKAVFPSECSDLTGGDGGSGLRVQRLKGDETAETSGDLPEHTGAGKCLAGGLIPAKKALGKGVRGGGG